MPPGPGRGLLAGYLDEEIGLYALRQANPIPNHVRIGYWLGGGLAILGSFAWGAALFWLFVLDDGPNTSPSSLVSIFPSLVSGIGVGIILRTRRHYAAWLNRRIEEQEAPGPDGAPPRFRRALEREARLMAFEERSTDPQLPITDSSEEASA